MARKCNPRPSHNAVALIVDGKDEKWYIDKVKDHYPCEALKTIKVNQNCQCERKYKNYLILPKLN